jgi:hypothetical protein
MKKLSFGVILIALMIVLLVFIPNSPLNKSILHQLAKVAEENWQSEITYSDASINLWKGALVFDGLEIKTPKDTDSSWSLAIRNLAIEIDYFSWFMDHLKLNKLRVHDIIFSRHNKKGSDIQIEKMFSEIGGKRNEEKKSQKIENKLKSGILIKHLIVQGKLEIKTVYDSGKTDTVKIETFNINKKDVLFDGRPDTFMSSILNSGP